MRHPILFLAIFLTACVSGGGGSSYHPPGSDGGTRGGNNGSPADYVGNWIFQTGTISGSCSDGTMPKGTPSGQLLVADAGSGRVSIASAGCTVHFTVGAGVASLDAEQSCESNGQTTVFERGSLRASEGQLSFALTISMSGLRNGTTLSCVVDESGLLRK